MWCGLTWKRDLDFEISPIIVLVHVHSGSDVKKTATFFEVSFLNFHIYFVSEQGNRFGAKVISLGYLGYLNF